MKTLEYKKMTQIYLNSSRNKESNGIQFCRLELPQPSYCSIKTQVFYEIHFSNKFCNGFILKIQACAIMSGLHKSGHIVKSPSSILKYECDNITW